MYDAAGNMCGMLMQADRPGFAQEDLLRGNPEEVKSAFEGFQAYFGTYEANDGERNDGERMDIHHVIGCSFPNWEGTDRIRFFEFSGKKLTLSTPPLPAAGTTVTMRLVWARAA
jgi:endonuclease IV